MGIIRLNIPVIGITAIIAIEKEEKKKSSAYTEELTDSTPRNWCC